MSLNFENASILSLEKQINYFGSEYSFSCEKSISIEGFFYARSNLEGVKEIQQDLDDFVASTDGQLHDVIINGHNFGKGRVDSFSSGSGNSVRVKEYSVDLTIFEEGDLSSLSGEQHMDAFQGLISDTNRKFIRDLSEDFSFSKNNGSYEYSHQLSVQFYDHEEASIDGPIELAKTLAKTILESDVDFGFLDSQVSGFYNLAHKKYFSEEYDKVNKSCSFSESYSQDVATDQLYSVSRSHSLEVGEGGILNITESSDIGALTKVSASTLSGYISTELGGSYLRCSQFVQGFNEGLFTNSSLSSGSETDYSIINQAVDLSKTLDHFSCNASYSVSYSNDENIHVGFICEKTISASFDDEIATLNEQGSVRGLEGLESDQYTKAIDGFKNVIEPGIVSRVNAFYAESFPHLTSTLEEVSSSFNSDQNEGSLDYSKSYSTDPSMAESGFKSINTTEDVSLAVTYKNDFKVLASGQSKEQYKGLTPTQKKIKININGKRETLESACRQKAVEIANSFAPTAANNAHIQSLGYQFDKKLKKYTLDLDWVYYENSASICGNLVSIKDPAGKIEVIDSLVSIWRLDQSTGGLLVKDLYGGNDGSWQGTPSYGPGKYKESAIFSSGNYIDFGRGDGCPSSGPCLDPLPVIKACPTPSSTPSPTVIFPTPSGTWEPGVYPTETKTEAAPSPSASSSFSEEGVCYEDCPACGWDEILTSKVFSISLWYKPSSEGKSLLRKFDMVNPPEGTDRDNSFELFDGSYMQADGTITSFSKGLSGVWNHLVVACSDGTGGEQNGIYIYLNNSKIAVIDSPAFDKSNQTSLMAGTDFEGSMDDLRVYNKTLAPFEVSMIFNGEDMLPSGLSPYTPSTPTETL